MCFSLIFMYAKELSELLIRMFSKISENMTMVELFKLVDISYAYFIRTLRELELKGFLRIEKKGRTNYMHLTKKGAAFNLKCAELVSIWESKNFE